MINDLLDLEKMDVGMMKLQVSDTPVKEILDQAVASISGFADEYKMSIEMESDDSIVKGDRERLVQVLVNLLSNAIKFSPEGSTVRVTVVRSDNQCKVSVIDQGRGVPKEHQAAIFERFKQVLDSDGQAKKGTGLGLAIAAKIVELHKGKIGLESEGAGIGSTFWFSVPLSIS